MAMGGILNQTPSALPLNGNVYDAQNKRIVNVGNPIENSDAITLGVLKESYDNYSIFKKELVGNFTSFGQYVYVSSELVAAFNYSGVFVEFEFNNYKAPGTGSKIILRGGMSGNLPAGHNLMKTTNYKTFNGKYYFVAYFSALEVSSDTTVYAYFSNELNSMTNSDCIIFSANGYLVINGSISSGSISGNIYVF